MTEPATPDATAPEADAGGIGAPAPRPSMLTDDDPFVPAEIVPDAQQPDPKRPAKDATKDLWVAYAIDRGVPSYEAWAMTKPALIREVG